VLERGILGGVAADRLCEATVDGEVLELLCTDSFPVTAYTNFFLDFFPDVKAKRVLDFGTGCGALAVVAARKGAASVIACDVSPEALSLARKNAQKFGCNNISFARVDRHKPEAELGGSTFDVIVCNPASLPMTRFQREAIFYSGGKFGLAMINPLIDIASTFLSKTGHLRFIHTSLAPLHLSLSRLVGLGFSVAIPHVRELPFRDHYDVLRKYFSMLRSTGQIFYDNSTEGGPFELLYLVEAKRFPSEEGRIKKP
jgi:release factor glutamine methyltransferase